MGHLKVIDHSCLGSINAATAHLPPVQSYFSTLLGKVNMLGTNTIDLMSELLSFSPKGLSYLEVAMNCISCRCATCTKRQRQHMWRSQWTQLTELTFLVACLVRIAYFFMIGIILVCDFAALCISVIGLTRLRRPSWVVTC